LTRAAFILYAAEVIVVEMRPAPEFSGTSADPLPASGPERGIRLLLASVIIALAVLISGFAMIGVSVEPNSDYIATEPWLVVLSPDRIGIEFITYGRDFSAVLYGIVDSRGNWVVGPSPVTARYGYFRSPSGAVAVSDSPSRVHIAWSLVDGDLGVQSFHYLQLDRNGRVVAATGPFGNESLPPPTIGPVNPGIQVNTSTVEVLWTDQGSTWAATLDLNGRLIQPAHPFGGSFSGPARVANPLSSSGGSASMGSDGAGSTCYVWQESRAGLTYRQTHLEYGVHFYRTGPGGSVDRILYATDDFFWTSKPLVLPGFVLTLAGAVAVPILVALLAMRWRTRGRR